MARHATIHPRGGNVTSKKMSKVCPSCGMQHPGNYKRCAFCRSVLEPLPVKQDIKRDSKMADPIKSGGTITSGQITSGGVGDPGSGY
jgi:hypothetical protein